MYPSPQDSGTYLKLPSACRLEASSDFKRWEQARKGRRRPGLLTPQGAASLFALLLLTGGGYMLVQHPPSGIALPILPSQLASAYRAALRPAPADSPEVSRVQELEQQVTQLKADREQELSGAAAGHAEQLKGKEGDLAAVNAQHASLAQELQDAAESHKRREADLRHGAEAAKKVAQHAAEAQKAAEASAKAIEEGLLGRLREAEESYKAAAAQAKAREEGLQSRLREAEESKKAAAAQAKSKLRDAEAVLARSGGEAEQKPEVMSAAGLAATIFALVATSAAAFWFSAVRSAQEQAGEIQMLRMEAEVKEVRPPGLSHLAPTMEAVNEDVYLTAVPVCMVQDLAMPHENGRAEHFASQHRLIFCAI